MPTVIEGIKFYKVPEVAEAVNVTPQTVRKWIKEGRIEAVRIGRPVYITEKCFFDFLTNTKARTTRNPTTAEVTTTTPTLEFRK
ncbi:MAG: helix-turn-helix domain-containing protein [Candidatus Delongbacteria bacterium]|jgi:excisionase family DNA binding protein|nr:helix-turn-helix domain-containing protein [Candidatus Delongbacteria bacterium]